ncbi:hypothetical protein CPU12_05835 [Malaciobacter molluscorum LMG 25693]|uniref:Uncharacterized protein n=1 Tax=Malaciobacter molluscorum LMG 25693 TaxID=870501 RepID=A0A2G1DIR8_9BACT|nr:hypothetical protein [Malaciobacter molluscorum]AXX91827.1 hypothetical protein AMOL_0833 [Malaciobacter molluscorum LMG 25693]PHO18236.1 hypothetical protein CPU12_05835 [Malaciobacter molluscorum LMG 25693]RXJ94119.1 hypothetical protein CRV00_07780 [Malaciobacter molluscorum]
MIEYISEISNEDNYKKYNHFLITENLNELLHKDYYVYNTKNFNKSDLVEELYNKNFVNKYDNVEHKQIFDLYINNDKFKEKAQFIYSIIDNKKFEEFAKSNPDIENADEYTIIYNIVDSDGVKVTMYQLSLKDIAFVF